MHGIKYIKKDSFCYTIIRQYTFKDSDEDKPENEKSHLKVIKFERDKAPK